MNNNFKGLIRMNLQLLAEDTGADGEGKEADVKTYTEDEVNSKIQSETDRRVTEALKTARSKWEKEYEEKLAKEKSEAEKLAKMTADERAKAEFEEERKKFEEDRAKFQRDQLELETVKELTKLGINTEFSSFLMGKDAEETNSNIKLFKEKFDNVVESMVLERLKGKTPSTTSQPNNSFKFEDLKGMSISDINKNWDNIKSSKF